MLKKYSKNIIYAVVSLTALIIGFLFIAESKKTNNYVVKAGASISPDMCTRWSDIPNRHCHKGMYFTGDDGDDGGSGEVVYKGFGNK